MHRASGALLIVGVAVLLWLLDQSLASPEGFEQARQALQSPLAKFILWVVVSALAYHTVAGVKHLVMDMGFGETMEGGVIGAKVVIATSVLLIILAGLWIW